MISSRQRQYPAWILPVVRWTAAGLILGTLFHYLPLGPLRAAFARIPLSRFIAILIIYLSAHVLGIVKWRTVVNSAGARLDFATAAQCYAGGLFATLFLPSIVGGDLVRLAVGLRRSPSPAAVLAGNIADRFLDVAAQGALVTLGLCLLSGSLPFQLRSPAVRVFSWVTAVVLFLLMLSVLLRRPLLRGRSFRARRYLARLRYALRSVSRRPHILLVGWLLGLGIQSVLLALTALLASSCGLTLPLRVWLFAWPLAKLAALIPLTQGGIGVREAALVALLVPFGASASLVLAVGLLWEGVIISGGLIAGIAVFFLRRSEPVLHPV
ncbi:MAG TPA: lysylphosphatidylglycerol synthase transmembrane domain-containing protein [Candidatus Dormibacteraeota bacterium]|nr:lysylphosphatidylglycerol synthase transmembrane domain-containing protein [Candidatus Dormibacteraeota bacterium]